MFTRFVTVGALLAGMLVVPELAQAEQAKVGSLRCQVSGGLGLIVTSKKHLRCVFHSAHGYTERYDGVIRKFGLDIGATSQGVLAWGVLSSTGGPRRGALAGKFIGATASATIGAGVGANVLVGGNHDTISLQPLSVEANTGLNLAGGVAALTLHSVN